MRGSAALPENIPPTIFSPPNLSLVKEKAFFGEKILDIRSPLW
jgi:hypothetical protein